MSAPVFSQISNLTPQLISQWQQLWNSSSAATIYNSPKWYQAALAASPDTTSKLLTLTRDGNLQAILPLVTSRRFGIKVQRYLNDSWVYGTGLLYEKETDLNAIFGFLISNGAFYFTRIDEIQAKLLHNWFPQLFFTRMAVVPYLDLNPDPHRNIPHKQYKVLRRIIKSSSSNLSLGIAQLNKNSAALEACFEIDRISAKSRRGMSTFADEKYCKYYRNLANQFGAEAYVFTLQYFQHLIAYQIGIAAGGVFYGLQMAYLSSFSHLSPGKVLNFLVLSELKSRYFQRIDLGAGFNEYKRRFTHDFYSQYDVYYSPNRTHIKYWQAVNKIRRIKKRLLPTSHTLDHLYLFTPLS